MKTKLKFLFSSVLVLILIVGSTGIALATLGGGSTFESGDGDLAPNTSSPPNDASRSERSAHRSIRPSSVVRLTRFPLSLKGIGLIMGTSGRAARTVHPRMGQPSRRRQTERPEGPGMNRTCAALSSRPGSAVNPGWEFGARGRAQARGWLEEGWAGAWKGHRFEQVPQPEAHPSFSLKSWMMPHRNQRAATPAMAAAVRSWRLMRTPSSGRPPR